MFDMFSQLILVFLSVILFILRYYHISFSSISYSESGKNLQIEHAQHLAPGTAARFGEQKVFASVQVTALVDSYASFGF